MLDMCLQYFQRPLHISLVIVIPFSLGLKLNIYSRYPCVKVLSIIAKTLEGDDKWKNWSLQPSRLAFVSIRDRMTAPSYAEKFNKEINHVERKVPKYENHKLRERKVKTLTRN